MKSLSRCRDLTGQKFGRLTVIGLDDSKQSRKTYWICQCECGNMKSVRSDSLLCGDIKSCGCLHKEQAIINVSKHHSHKQSGTRLYHIWQGIRKRCNDKNSPCYDRYGGRDIKVCAEWNDSFEPFYEWAINNGYSDDLSIDRIDNNGNYEPDNCRWATNQEQSRNRRSNINITIGNATKTLTEWCEIFDMEYKIVVARYHRNPDQTLDELFSPIPR